MTDTNQIRRSLRAAFLSGRTNPVGTARSLLWLLLATATAWLLAGCGSPATPAINLPPTFVEGLEATATLVPAVTPTGTPAPSMTATTAPTPTATATATTVPTPTASVTVTALPTTPQPTAAPTIPTASQEPVRIVFERGMVGTQVDGAIEANGIDRYVLRALKGQTMSVGIASPRGDVLLSVVGADGIPLKRYVDDSPEWTGELPATQDYFLDAVSVGPATGYRLSVLVEPLGAGPSPPERVTFAPGATSATRSGALRAGEVVRYVLRASAGQVLQVNVTSYQAPLDLTVGAPDGSFYGGQGVRGEYYGNILILVLPVGGDYVIALGAIAGPTDYDVEFIVEGAAPPPPLPERVRFAPGATSSTIAGVLPAGGGSVAYVVRALAGQTMDVRVFGDGPSLFTVRSPSGVTWPGQPFGLDGYGRMTTITLPEVGDYVITLATAAGAPATSYEAAITVVDSSAQPPTAPPERVSFALGTSAASRDGSMPAGGGLKQYVLGAMAGQTMQVRVTSDNAPVTFEIRGPSGTIWPAEQVGSEAYVYARTIVLPQSGDHVVTLTSLAGAPATLYTVSFDIQ